MLSVARVLVAYAAADAAVAADAARFGLPKKCANIVREVYIILKKKKEKDGNT